MFNLFKFIRLGGRTKVRFPPSPTGPFHIGSARTALFNYIFARQSNGKLIFRSEDTDKERSTKEFEEDILDGLDWLGIKYDEFYRQSERTEIYKKYIKKLLREKKAFYCNHTKEELEEEKNKQMANKEAPRHICEHKHEIRNSKFENKGIIRIKGTNEKIKFNDMVRGGIEFEGNTIGDVSIAKNLDTPLYNFAVVVDDWKMKITHVIRGEDGIPNTPKQILIQKALGAKPPKYAHIPLILGSDKSKLSKRHGATSINEYKRVGYLPEALVNFMVLLGWNPGDNKEIISIKELIKIFSLSKVQKGGAVFNIEKLNWFNKEYIKTKNTKKLTTEVIQYLNTEQKKLAENNSEKWEKIVELEKERLTTLSDINKNVDFIFKLPPYQATSLVWKKDTRENTQEHLDKLIGLLSKAKSSSFSKENIKKAVWEYAEKEGRGNVLWPLRVSLTGLEKSPEPFAVAEILGKEECLKRLNYAKEILSK